MNYACLMVAGHGRRHDVEAPPRLHLHDAPHGAKHTQQRLAQQVRHLRFARREQTCLLGHHRHGGERELQRGMLYESGTPHATPSCDTIVRQPVTQARQICEHGSGHRDLGALTAFAAVMVWRAPRVLRESISCRCVLQRRTWYSHRGAGQEASLNMPSCSTVGKPACSRLTTALQVKNPTVSRYCIPAQETADHFCGD